MEDRIRLKVMGISYSQIQAGAYALILEEVGGPRRIPVVISADAAQSIAIKLEGIIPPRPLTHDLFTSFVRAYGIKLQEVFIYKFEEGIFSSELTFTDGDRQVVLDSRTSDAIAIALRTKTPIFTTRQILEETGFIMEIVRPGEVHKDEEIMPEEEFIIQEPKIENYTIDELERTLQHLIDTEDYEQAAKVSKILNEKRKNSHNDDIFPI